MLDHDHFEPTPTDAAPVLHPEPCGSCGAPVELADKFCGTCGAEQSAAAEVHDPAPEQKHIRCKNCSAEVALDPDRRSYTCAFCDSNYVVEFSPDATVRQRPEFVIGFGVTEDRAAEIFREWLADNSWFHPSDLKTAQIAEKLQGIYLPFWSFSMLAQSRWAARIGEYWHRTETYTTTQNGKPVTRTRRVRETEWWPLDGRHHHYYNGYLISGSRGLSQQQADHVKPFHLAALRRYEPYYLAGWLSEEYSIDHDEALETCRREFLQRERQNISAMLPGDTSGDLRVDTDFQDESSDLILLPIYLLSYRYGDKLYRFMINGQTGKSAGDKPVSRRKIAAVVIAAVATIAMLAAMVAWMSG